MLFSVKTSDKINETVDLRVFRIKETIKFNRGVFCCSFVDENNVKPIIFGPNQVNLHFVEIDVNTPISAGDANLDFDENSSGNIFIQTDTNGQGAEAHSHECGSEN